MTAGTLLAGSLAAAGVGLVLSGFAWFRQAPLWVRLQPYLPARTTGEAVQRTELAEHAATAASGARRDLSARVHRLLGSNEQLESRLASAGLPADAAAFRTRQFSVTLVGALAALATVLALRPPAPLALALLVGAPVLGALAVEHRLDRRIEARRAALVVALPVTIEQLGLLVGAGYSLTSALTRLAERSTGVVADSLTGVVRRVRQGRSEVDALREWAADSQLPQVERLVGVLALHREAGDLGALLSGEAAAVRAETHRALIETIERRSQLVWVPVTVATLVPGLILLAVPFLSAVAMVTGT